MILSDSSIRNLIEQRIITIDPYEPSNIQPASLDIRLGTGFARSVPLKNDPIVDLAHPEQSGHTFSDMYQADKCVLEPGGFLLGTTLERVVIPNHLVAVVNGKSSLGRMGLLIHITAGHIDPGFSGQITLELANVSRSRLLLESGMKIGQLVFYQLDQASHKPYGHPDLNSKYQHQQGTTLTKYYLNR